MNSELTGWRHRLQSGGYPVVRCNLGDEATLGVLGTSSFTVEPSRWLSSWHGGIRTAESSGAFILLCVIVAKVPASLSMRFGYSDHVGKTKEESCARLRSGAQPADQPTPASGIGVK